MKDDFVGHPPGILKEITDHIHRRAFQLQPEHAIAAALSLTATVLGRRFCSESGLQTNLFLLSVGPDSTGKRRSMRTVAEILEATGLEHLLVWGELADRDALIARVAQRLSILLQYNSLTMVTELLGLNQLDEEANNILAELVELHDNAATGVTCGIASDKIMRISSIKHPCVNVHTSMTGDRMSLALKASVEAVQFLNRALIVDASMASRGNQRHRRSLNYVPVPILDWISLVTDEGSIAPENYEPKRVVKTPEADRLFNRFKTEIAGKRSVALGSETVSPWAYALEQTDKIALIAACAEDPNQPIVAEQHVWWAIGFVRYCAELLDCRLAFEASHSRLADFSSSVVN